MAGDGAIDRWLEAYRKAWRSDAPDDIAALFEPDARYFTEPYRYPHAGRDAIVSWWIENGDSSVPTTFEWQVLTTGPELNVVKGVTTYPKGSDGRSDAEVYDNIWLVTLAPSGRAAEFVEYWMQRP